MLLDFPELAEDPLIEEAAQVIDGEVALGFVALRQIIRDGKLDNPEHVLANLPPPIHPFALERLAVPKHERQEDARIELIDNLKKLRSLESKREKSDVTEELERAQRIGDWKQEEELLRQRNERAKRQLERLRT